MQEGANISDLDEAAVLIALYNSSQPQGLGFLHFTWERMPHSEAVELLKTHREFDYLKGRVMKVRFFAAGELRLIDQSSAQQEADSLLRPVWRDGLFLIRQTFPEIRERALASVK